jgi:TonB family protein
MNRRIFITSLAVLIAGAVITQARQGDIGSGPKPISDPSSWKRYTVEGEEFSVLLPMLPAMTTIRGMRKHDGNYQTQRQIETYVDGLLYTIDVYENSKPRLSLNEFFSEYKDDVKCDPDGERAIAVDGYSGKECSSTDKDHPGIVQFFATETHLYRFLVRRRPEVAEEVGRKFFSSIRLGQNTDGIKVTDGPGDGIATAGVPDEKVRLLKKPEPSYTDEARANKIAGTVILKVVFTSKGTVENIRVVRSLPDGLTERAIEAAKKIKFVPATKDGHPVSMWIQLEYNFWP